MSFSSFSWFGLLCVNIPEQKGALGDVNAAELAKITKVVHDQLISRNRESRSAGHHSATGSGVPTVIQSV
jgi:hypothetical protein